MVMQDYNVIIQIYIANTQVHKAKEVPKWRGTVKNNSKGGKNLNNAR